ncbi:ComF family protein [Anaplasma capra]|uniref:ComF family protein n=1 Tax=Anaplasma capra TaxID=1562740 RepID=UPI0021D5F1DE|nr:ComF family protein [Anaplasma capra]MCU7611223.1 ComF family protein [Anaplasma capra]MCU7612595.1 ComF family protein [Anaplasma capra]
MSAISSVFAYDERSKNMVLRLKFCDDLFHVKEYARWMSERGKTVLEGVDFIVPVPTHRMRLLRRKYNQAALLAQAVGRYSGIPSDVFVLQKLKNTSPQRNLPANVRKRNVHGVLAVTNTDRVQGKVIALVDDVITTGATIAACASILKSAGALEVRALTLGKTLL